MTLDDVSFNGAAVKAPRKPSQLWALVDMSGASMEPR